MFENNIFHFLKISLKNIYIFVFSVVLRDKISIVIDTSQS